MEIWLISLFDPTPLDQPISPRFIGIAQAGIKKNHRIKHFTSTFRHTSKKHRFNSSQVHKENDNYEVIFIKSMSYKRNMLPKRFIAHLDFARKLVKRLDTMPKPDAIFISMPPLSTVNLVSKWGNKNNVPVIIDIIDPWPDSFIKDVPNFLKKFSKVFIASFYKKLKKSFENSSAITAISNGYLQWASEHHTKNKRTSCFYLAMNFRETQNIYTEFSKLNLNKDLSVLRLIYAGSLASSYDIPTIINAAKELNEKYPGKTEFIITGDGPQKGIITEAMKYHTNIKYLGYVSKDELFRQYYLADIGLIQHKNSLTQTITYKFFNYLSAGLVLLNSLQSEMADLIEKEELGLNNLEGDWPKLVKNIEVFLNNKSLLEQYKKNALSFASDQGDSNMVYGRLINFIEDIIECHQ